MKDICRIPRNKPFLNIKVELFKISNPASLWVKMTNSRNSTFANAFVL